MGAVDWAGAAGGTGEATVDNVGNAVGGAGVATWVGEGEGAAESHPQKTTAAITRAIWGR